VSDARRSCLAVPGSSPRFLAKAQGLAADEIFLDLEDAVAPDAKVGARRNVIAALRDGDWRGKVRAVRINGAGTAWAYRDVIEVAEQAGPRLDAIVLPKASAPQHVTWLDLLLGQIETVNAAFSPGQPEYDRAELILEAYQHYTSVARRGAAMLDGEMIDEASRKLAMVAAARGRAAGLTRTRHFQPPSGPEPAGS